MTLYLKPLYGCLQIRASHWSLFSVVLSGRCPWQDCTGAWQHCRKCLILCDFLIELSRYKERLVHIPHWAQLIMFCLVKKRHTLHTSAEDMCYLFRIRVLFLQTLLVLIKINPSPATDTVSSGKTQKLTIDPCDKIKQYYFTVSVFIRLHRKSCMTIDINRQNISHTFFSLHEVVLCHFFGVLVVQWLRHWNPSTTKLSLLNIWARPLTLFCTVMNEISHSGYGCLPNAVKHKTLSVLTYFGTT